MQYITQADPYIGGNSTTWKNWQSKYQEEKTCIPCEDIHGKIYPFDTPTYIPAHTYCRCKIIPMRTKQVGTSTREGWNGADAWLMYRKKLPSNYITKEEALKAGWRSKKINLATVCPGKIIGGVPFFNNEGKLPDAPQRMWHEADFDYTNNDRGSNRIFYSNDGLIFISYDHAHTFYELIK